MWILLAIVSAGLHGAVAVTDKRLIDKHMPSLSSYYLWVGLTVLLHGLLFLAVSGLPDGAPPASLLAAGASGLCWGGALMLMFWGYRFQEVSRVSALIYTFPVFVALLATLFLGESLAAVEWVAIGVVVLGAFLISFNGSPNGSPNGPSWTRLFGLNRALPILIGASLLTALGHLTGKYALEELSVWLVTSLRFFGMGVALTLLWRPQAAGQLLRAMRRKRTLALLCISEGILVPLTAVLMITATSLGPVSLVATLTGTRPFFVLLYSSLLSVPRIKVLDESLSPRALTGKLVSVTMIVGGIVLLSLLAEGVLGGATHVK